MIALKIKKKKKRMLQDQPKPEGGRIYKPPVVGQLCKSIRSQTWCKQIYTAHTLLNLHDLILNLNNFLIKVNQLIRNILKKNWY